MAQDKVSIFTTAMRAEFLNSYQAVAAPAPWEAYTQVIPSTARIENYPWLSPVPAIEEYKGNRRFGKISEVKYTVTNLEYDSAFEVLLRDIEDDQVGGYTTKPQELAHKAKMFPGRLALQHLAAGTSTACFDGSNFFANSHTIGSGDNYLSKDCASNDGVAHRIVVLVNNGPLKPLIYQQRKEPRFESTSGSADSLMSKLVRYWIDLEGAAAYGHWWNAVMVEITDTPSLTEVQTIFGDVETAFKSFQLPSGQQGNSQEYVHEQLQHDTSNTVVLCGSKIANLVRQVLLQETILQSGSAITNIYKGWGSLVTTNFLAP